MRRGRASGLGRPRRPFAHSRGLYEEAFARTDTCTLGPRDCHTRLPRARRGVLDLPSFRHAERSLGLHPRPSRNAQ